MRITSVKLIQSRLKELGFYSGRIDGLRGPKTTTATQKALLAKASKLPADWKDWSDKRKAIAFLQLTAIQNQIDAGAIDGWWGPQTEFAVDSLLRLRETGTRPENWRDEEPMDVNPNKWPKGSESALTGFYGPHGEKDGFEPPMVSVRCPWKLRISWNLNIATKTIRIHKDCADSLGRILAKIHTIYGDEEIKRLRLDYYGGSYNARQKRNGSSWSTHAWAIAIDWDPGRNKLKWNRTQASLARPDYNDWWKCWEEEGWLSLGRTRNFDWMHIQAAKR